jgi:hypothetical protein
VKSLSKSIGSALWINSREELLLLGLSESFLDVECISHKDLYSSTEVLFRGITPSEDTPKDTCYIPLAILANPGERFQACPTANDVHLKTFQSFDGPLDARSLLPLAE